MNICEISTRAHWFFIIDFRFEPIFDVYLEIVLCKLWTLVCSKAQNKMSCWSLSQTTSSTVSTWNFTIILKVFNERCSSYNNINKHERNTKQITLVNPKLILFSATFDCFRNVLLVIFSLNLFQSAQNQEFLLLFSRCCCCLMSSSKRCCFQRSDSFGMHTLKWQRRTMTNSASNFAKFKSDTSYIYHSRKCISDSQTLPRLVSLSIPQCVVTLFVDHECEQGQKASDLM